MTDHDPAPPRRRRPSPSATGSAAGRPSTPAARDARASRDSGGAAGPAAGPTALRDRWWWSPTLSIVIGLVVVGYQLDPLRGANPLWGNWVVAALGLGVAVWGVVRLVRAARSR